MSSSTASFVVPVAEKYPELKLSDSAVQELVIDSPDGQGPPRSSSRVGFVLDDPPSPSKSVFGSVRARSISAGAGGKEKRKSICESFDS